MPKKFDPIHMFGNIVRTYRKKHQLTQEELAESLNISARQISRIENGGQVTLS